MTRFVRWINPRNRVVALVACATLAAIACEGEVASPGESLGDRWADSLVEGTRRAILERERGELPLPDDVPFSEIDLVDLQPDENFRIDLVDDLVIGDDHKNVNYIFGNLDRTWSLASVAVDNSDRIFVLNWRNRRARIQVHSADGAFLHRFGRQGLGPGDLYYPRWLIVSGTQVLVFHRRYYWGIWGLDGEFARHMRVPGIDTKQKPARTILAAGGLADGSVVTMYPFSLFHEEGRQLARNRIVAKRFDADGNETELYFEVPEAASPRIAVSDTGEVYASFVGNEGKEYYVVAIAADASVRWFTIIKRTEEFTPWAELRLDHAGHLYVMPSYNSPADGRRPVHVYTTGGDFVGSGYLNRSPENLHWQTARDGKVYGVRIGKESREWEVVRYRLEMSRGSGQLP